MAILEPFYPILIPSLSVFMVVLGMGYAIYGVARAFNLVRPLSDDQMQGLTLLGLGVAVIGFGIGLSAIFPLLE